MKFLIIDDDLSAMDQLQQLILNFDVKHDVETSHSSYDALQKLRKNEYDIVFTEIYLQGGMQGHQIITTAREKTFKVGMAQKLENPMIRQPFNFFILKPVTAEDVKEVVKMAKYNLEYMFL